MATQLTPTELGHAVALVPGTAPSEASAPPVVAGQTAPVQRRLRTGALWVILGRSLGIGITMLVNVALARWLSPDEFGSFLLLSSVLALASLLAMVGLNQAIVRFISESLGMGDVGRARQSMRLVLAVAMVSITSVASLAALALVYFDTSLLGLPSVPALVPMMVAGLVLLALLQLVAEACRSLHELRLASLFSGGQTGGLLSNVLFLTLIAAALVVGKPSFSAAVALNLAAMAITLPLAIFGLSRAVRDRLPQPAPGAARSTLSLRELLAFSLPIMLIQLLVFTTTQADLWIAGICWQHDQLALYGAARRLMLLVALPLQMANLTVIASIAELHGQQRRAELERLLRRATSLAAWPSIAAIVLLILAGGPILQLLFGPFFREAALPLAILGIGQLFLVWAGSCGCALEMTGHQLGSLAINLVSAIALATVGVWSASRFGILGLSIASATIIAAQSLSLLLLAKKLVGVWTHPSISLGGGGRR